MKSSQYQQNLEWYPVTIVVLNSFTSKVEDLITYLPSLRLQMSYFEKHKAYVIDK